MSKKQLMDNVFKLDNIEELSEILDVDFISDSEQYILYGSIDSILDELEYNGFDLKSVIKNTTNGGFGYSFWDLYYIKNEDEYYLINNFI